MPADDDILLRVEKPCPAASQERDELLVYNRRVRLLLKDNHELLNNLSLLSGKESIKTRLIDADQFHENMAIEHAHGYFWTDKLDNWNSSLVKGWFETREQEVEILKKMR